MHGLLAAGHGDGFEGRQARIIECIAHQELAPPDLPILAIARAIENEADGGAGMMVFGQAGSQMGMMMLDG